MRISDWSSDVCASDLRQRPRSRPRTGRGSWIGSWWVPVHRDQALGGTGRMATALSGDTGWNYANHAGDYGIAPGSNHKRLDLDAFAVGRRWRDIGRRTTTSHGLGSDLSKSRVNNKARNAGLVRSEVTRLNSSH